MPATSIDTFFACSLMVLLVLSAMASTSKLLYPHIINVSDENTAERYREIANYILLNGGLPSNWGQNCNIVPESFGLAKANLENLYELDIDKVSRLNSENLYAITYAQIFDALKMPDMSLRTEIKPMFEVAINLSATSSAENETTYQFKISTENQGVPVQASLKFYVIAESYLETYYVNTSNGNAKFNITLPNTVKGPALLVAFAKAGCEPNIVSFGTFAFAHNSDEPKTKATFLRLSPLNYTLTASIVHSGINLSKAYALTINHYSNLTQNISNNQSVTYDLPHFLDPNPSVIVVTGWNSTAFFTEWTVYPQIPLQIGANFASLAVLSNVFAYTYLITINSALYECTVWLGGSKR